MTLVNESDDETPSETAEEVRPCHSHSSATWLALVADSKRIHYQGRSQEFNKGANQGVWPLEDGSPHLGPEQNMETLYTNGAMTKIDLRWLEDMHPCRRLLRPCSLPTGRACLAVVTTWRPWPALDRRGRSATSSTFWLSPTAHHAANATSHVWRPFIPCDGGTGI